MLWLGLLIAFLTLLLVFLVLPLPEWGRLLARLGEFLSRGLRRFTERRKLPTPAASEEEERPVAAEQGPVWRDRLAAVWQGLLSLLGQEAEEPPVRTWEESPPAPSEEDLASWQERSGRPTAQRLAGVPAGPVPAATRQADQRASGAVFSHWLVFFAIVVLVILLLISLYRQIRMAGPLPLPREQRLIVAVADLDIAGEGPMSPARAEASEELQRYLQREVEEAGLAGVVELKAVHETPADAAVALNLARSNNADLLLWGDYLRNVLPHYSLTLTLFLRPTPAVPEFDEYLQWMMTPAHFPLVRLGEVSLSEQDLAAAVVWLAHFYLGQFDRIEGEGPEIPPTPVPTPVPPTVPPPTATLTATVQLTVTQPGGAQLTGIAPPKLIGCPDLALDVLDFHCAGLMWLHGEYERAQEQYAILLQRRYVEVIGDADVAPCAGATTTEICAAAFNNQAVALLTRQSLVSFPSASVRQAAALLERAAQVAPQAAVVQYNLGRTYLALRDWEGAVEALRKAVQSDPGHGPALAALSAAYRGIDDAGRAEGYARRALEVAPNLPEAHLAMGGYWLAMAKWEEAGREYDEALRLAEAEGKRRRSREVALSEAPQPNPERAVYLAAWARRSDPLLPQVHFAQANRFLLQGQLEQDPGFIAFLWRLIVAEPSTLDRARAEVDTVLAARPGWYEALYLQGELALVQQAYEEAAAAFQRAQAQDGDVPEAYLALADTYQRQGRREEAALQYRQLVDGGIAPAQGHFGLGELARQGQEWELAREEYRLAVETKLDYAEAYLRWGSVDFALGNDEEALEHLGLAIEEAGRQGWVRLFASVEWGEILLEQYLGSKAVGEGDRELLGRARTKFEQAWDSPDGAARRFPTRAQGIVIKPGVSLRGYEARRLNGLGRIAYEEGRGIDAEELFKRVLQLDGRNFDARYGLGRVFLARGDSANALSSFSRAVEINRQSIAAHYYMGVASYAQLKPGDARRAYERTIQLCEEQKDRPRRKADDLESCQQAPIRLEQLNASP